MSTTTLPVRYGETVQDLSCLDPTHLNEGVKSVTCVGDDMFLMSKDENRPDCPTGINFVQFECIFILS